ncbi:pH-response regulator protein palF/Rim8p [Monosporozyma servazzii]
MPLRNIWKRASGSTKDAERPVSSPQESVSNASVGINTINTINSNNNNTSAKHWVRQYYLSLDEPHRLYKPGETLSGELVLELKRDMVDLNLDLILSGQVKVRLRNATGTGLKSMKPVDFLTKKTTIYGKQNEKGLSEGAHKFPFKLKLPSKRHLYNEIKFERGKVEYSLKSTLSYLSKTSTSNALTQCEIPLHVFVPLDVSPYASKQRNKTVVLQSSTPSLAMATKPKSHISEDVASSTFTQTSANSSSFNVLTKPTEVQDGTIIPKTVRISVSIPQSGYVIGESIPITINLQHYKEYFHSSGVVITLVRICRVGSVESMNMETFRKDVCQIVSPLVVDDSTNFQSIKTIPLRIPQDLFSTFTTNRDDLFNFTYYVEVLVNLSRKNQVITNNNVFLSNGGNSISSSSTSHNRLLNSTHTLEQQSKMFRTKLLPMMLENDDITVDTNGNDTGSSSHPMENQTIFNDDDMINVETLKRQRNITGMSIELIIGNVRNIPTTSAVPPQSQQQQQVSPPSFRESLPSYTLPSDTIQQDLVNESIRRNEDKQDLEHERLATLESEPPDVY